MYLTVQQNSKQINSKYTEMLSIKSKQKKYQMIDKLDGEVREIRRRNMGVYSVVQYCGQMIIKLAEEQNKIIYGEK